MVVSKKLLLIALFPVLLSAVSNHCLDAIESMHSTGNSAMDTRSQALFEVTLIYATEASVVCKDPFFKSHAQDVIKRFTQIVGDYEYRNRKDYARMRARLRRSR